MSRLDSLRAYMGIDRIKTIPWMASNPQYQALSDEHALETPSKEPRDGHAAPPSHLYPTRRPSRSWIIPWVLSFALLITVLVLLPKTISYRKLAYPPPLPAPAAPVPAEEIPERAVVMATTSKHTTKWHTRIPTGWEIYRYVSDDPEAELTVPRNQGREAMVYLTYIVDHYNALPNYTVFTHGQEKAWHQPEPLPFVLDALNLTYVAEAGYVNLRCTLVPSCSPVKNFVNTTHTPPGDFWRAYMIRNLHEYAYRPEDPWYDHTLPEVNGLKLPPQFASPCCAQFAVTRDTVLRKPFEFWSRLRELLKRDIDDFKDDWWPGVELEDETQFVGVNEWNIGNAFERMWHYFFDMPPVHCPDEDHCRKVVYQDKISCNGSTTIWVESQNFPEIKCNMTY